MIKISDEGALRVLTLNRPDKANALTRDMLNGLRLAVKEASEAGSKVLILTGQGPVFSAGADLDAARAGLATDPVWEHLSTAIAGFSGLTIAALNGTLAGGAFGMALACDLRLSVPGAKFFYPVMKLGYLPQPSDPGRLKTLIGPARAAMILLSGAKIAAEEALAWGLIDRIVAPDALMATARELADAALCADAGHGARIKAMLRGG